jgi:signal transduction histidine kinase
MARTPRRRESASHGSASPRWRECALLAALAVVVAAEAWPHAGPVAAGVVWSTLVVVTAQRRPAWALAIGASATLLALADLPGTDAWPVLVSAAAGAMAGRRMADTVTAAAVFAGVAAAGLVVAVATGDAWAWFPVGFLLLVFGVLPWLAGRYLRLRATLAEAGWQRAEQLERERQLVEREARLRERAGIARDMHDSLGHELSLIAMQAGALELDGDLDERHRAAIAHLRSTAVDATDRLQDIVTVLRGLDDAEPGSIDDLVTRSRSSGVDIRLVSSGPTDDVPASVGRTAYRVVQEAVTNAVRHAPGAAVTVEVRFDGTHVSVAVRNGAGRGAAPTTGGGHGLVGLCERVRLAGGTLRAGRHGDGYEVVAELPYRVDGSDSARQLSEVTRATRRGLAAAVAVPVAIGAVVALLLLGMRWYEVHHSFLAADRYDALRVGDPRTQGLPRNQVEGRPDVAEPPVPSGARCEYYRTTRDLFTGPIDVYRLCFTDGRLADKVVVPGTAR